MSRGLMWGRIQFRARLKRNNPAAVSGPAREGTTIVKAMCISLGPAGERKRFHPRATIVLSKTLVYRDYDVVYGGAVVGLAGLLAHPLSEKPDRAELIAVRDGDERRRLVIRLFGELIDRSGGFISQEEALTLLSRARIDRRNAPLSFYAEDAYERRLASFLSRIEREGMMGEGDRLLLVCEAEVNALAARWRGTGLRRKYV